ncbi:ABC transporter permease subunit [Kribbella sancticallisti]|uniref:ABC transporter permease subunit n=2 Tax=Kribbella sancticallisti TaxID=460087 RepID=A0ABN2DQB3_9ACTN
MHAEWTKLRTVRSTAWLVLAVVAAIVTVAVMATGSVSTSRCPSPAECFEDTTKLSLTGVWLGQIAVVVLAVLTISGEYGDRLIQTTLTANPRRLTVLLTKATVVTGMVLAASTLGVLGSLLAGRILLPGNGFTAANGYPPLSLADGSTARAAAGTVLYLGLIALLSLGIATVVRDTAGAIISVLTLLYIFPLIAELVADPQWHERLQKLAPMTAGLSIQATTGLDRLAIGPWPGLGVLAGYATGAMLLGLAVFKLRDA